MKRRTWFVVSIAVASIGAGASGPIVDVYDGFETTNLSRVWSTDRFEVGAVKMQTNIVRAGQGAAQVTVHSLDKFEAGINGNKDRVRKRKRMRMRFIRLGARMGAMSREVGGLRQPRPSFTGL